MQPITFPDALGRLKKLAESAPSPAVDIRIERAEAPLSPFVSKYGGMPLTPEDFVWPTGPQGAPLQFIGQINFAEVAKQLPWAASELPHGGLVQFFCDPGEIWNADGPQEQSAWRLLSYPSPGEVAHVSFMEGEGFPETEFAMSFESITTWPDLESLVPWPELGAYSKEETNAFFDLSKPSCAIHHQLLGHPWAVQVDPRYDLLLNHLGDESYQEHYQTELDALGRSKELSDWVLLWQIDSDERLGYMWGDVGMLYLLIKRQALQVGDLSEPAFLLQCC